LQSETILNYASTTHREDSQLGNEQSRQDFPCCWMCRA
jgi:hypothetical protein